MNCKNCGAQLTGTENVCPNCGSPIENQVAAPEITPVEVAPVAEPVVESVSEVAPQPVAEVQPEVVEAPVVQPEVVATSEVAPQPEVVVPTGVEMAAAPVEAQPTPELQSIEPVQEQPAVVETPVVQPEVVATDTAMQPQPVAVPQQPAMPEPAIPQPAMPGAVPEQPFGAPTDAAQKAKPQVSKTTILLVTLAIVAVIAAVLYLTLFNNESDPGNGGSSSGTNTSAEVSNNEEDKVSYSGFDFVIPDGYQTKEDDTYGLMIYSSDTAFSIAADFTNKYEAYKTSLMAEYPDQAKDMVATVSGREYLALILTDEDGKQATEYVSKATDSSTFVGIVARKDYTAPTTTEFAVLTQILDSAKEGSTSFAPGDDKDVGKSGVKKYTFSKSKFTFGE